MSDRAPQRPQLRDDLVKMEGYHSPQIDVDVRLNTNESPFEPPAEFRAKLAEGVAQLHWNRYPDRQAVQLREAIAKLHNVAMANIFAANGSNEVLQSLTLAYGGPGRNVLVFEPTYAMHSQIARVTNTGVISGTRSDDHSLDLAYVSATMRQHEPAITFLCSPNNPTGMVEERETVEAVLAVAGEFGGLVVVDEAYGQFAPWSALELVNEDTALVVTRTYSKTWALAGLRLGYLVGPTWLVSALEMVVLPYHLDAATQLAGTLALDHVDVMEAQVAELVEERGRLAEAMADLPLTVWPSGANFILFRPNQHDGNAVWQELVDRSVMVRNCASWPGLDNCLRVTIGTRQEDDAFLAALMEILT